MCGNNNGICGCLNNNWWWIIILVLLFCNCGGCGNTFGGNGFGTQRDRAVGQIKASGVCNGGWFDEFTYSDSCKGDEYSGTDWYRCKV